MFVWGVVCCEWSVLGANLFCSAGVHSSKQMFMTLVLCNQLLLQEVSQPHAVQATAADNELPESPL
jgi:hypothetical protein